MEVNISFIFEEKHKTTIFLAKKHKTVGKFEDPLLLEVTVYTSPDFVGSRQLCNGLGLLYGAVTVAIQSGNSELISHVQEK